MEEDSSWEMQDLVLTANYCCAPQLYIAGDVASGQETEDTEQHVPAQKDEKHVA